MAAKPSIPKGTRDFSPVEMAKRNYIFNTIRDVYHLYGFQQIETPSMEMLSTLMGKYGDEGDKLLFKIQNSGDYFSGITDEELLSRNAVKLASKFCEKGLRYDLTVPFARYVVMHRDEITFPFKRYQIQPVWRADRPQKGRYREFYQCDADVVGSDSLLNEVELMQIVDTVFSRFNIRVCIKINNRKILSGIAEIIGESDKIVDITVAIDKLDKIGLDNVNAELKEKGISDEAIAKLQPIILLNGTNAEKLGTLKEVLSASEVGLKGVEESEFILNTLETMGLKNEIELDLTLARGLNYYTGAIFEVKALDVQIGSITGGGRYDNLTGVFGMSGVSGVGISFGADRIFDVLNQLELYPKEAVNGTEVLFINFGEKEAAFSMGVLAKVRAAGTIVYVALDGVYAGYIVIGDTLKKEVRETMDILKRRYHKELVMLTGDNEIVGGAVGKLLNMDHIYTNLLPAEKVEKVEEFIDSQQEDEKLVYVGDGINDAPVLKRADIGIAMGTLGAAAAVEAADIVLMEDDPSMILVILRIARETIGAIRQNAVLSIGMKLILLTLAATGLISMWTAITADVIIMLVTLFNALCLLKYPG